MIKAWRIMVVDSVANAYRAYLSQWYVLRLLKAVLMLFYKGIVFLRSRVFQVTLSGHYEFQPISSLTDGVAIRRLTIAQAKQTVIPAPDFSGFGAEQARLQNGPVMIDEPELEVFELSRAAVVGGVDFIFCSGIAIHHDLFQPMLHQCPAQNVGVISFDTDRLGLSLHLPRQPVYVEMGISLLGQCSANYAHWLTESLPKLAMVDRCADYLDFPLLVDDGLHPNIYESLELINVNRRKIIRVGRWSAVSVNTLVCLSSPGYERYLPLGLSMQTIAPYINRFSSFALNLLRERVLAAVRHVPAGEGGACYFSRSRKSKNIRQVSNSQAVEAIFSAYGFVTREPDAAGFIEQVQVCRTMQVIAAPVGACLANMIFCEPGSQIIVLAPSYDGASFFYYSNLAGVLGHRIHYVLGAQENRRKHPHYRNYHIDVSTLGTVLEVRGAP